VPIRMPTGITLRTVTFWYPATHLGITDWRETLANLFDDDLRPERRLLACLQADDDRTLLAVPVDGHPVRCAGGPVRLLDMAASADLAKDNAAVRYDMWSATGRVGARRPGPVELALLRAGRHAYLTYHSLRRVVGDALIVMADQSWLYPAGASPQALLDHVHHATLRLADAAADDVLVTVAA
jgi:hypothetical protein